MKRFLLASVMAMTVIATSMTAVADEPVASALALAPAPAPAPSVVPVPDLAAATPLAARLNPPAPAKPLSLAPASEGLGVGYKLLAIIAIGGAVALYLKKKRGGQTAKAAPSKIEILARAGLGVRSQLVVVEVEGTRLLVGMTPSAIQTLAVLQTPEDDGVVALGPAIGDVPAVDMIRPANLGDRVRSLLGTDEPIMPRLASVKAPASKPRPTRINARTTGRAKADARDTHDSREVAGQARGLLLSVDEDT